MKKTATTVTQKSLERTLIKYGFWTNDGSDTNRRYQLSPDIFNLSEKHQKQLSEIGDLVVDYYKGLQAYAKKAIVTKGSDRMESMFRKIMVAANSGFPLLSEDRSIPISKIDIMVDIDGNLKIAEIDAYNPRGNAFAIFLQEFYKQHISDTVKMYPGVSSYIDSITTSNEIIWPYAERERYYGGMLNISSKMFNSQTGKIIQPIAMKNLNVGEITNEMIYIIPWGISWKEEVVVRDLLIDLYSKKPNQFLYPMMPWLGSKAFMGIVSNPTQHQLLTDMVSNNFTRRDLVNKYIPKTIPVGKTTKDHVMNFYKDKKTILKANVSSGMKDIYTSEHTEFEKILLQSCNTKNTNYILQEMVDQKTFTFNVFNAQTGKLEVQNHYLRITGYIGADGSVLDAEVTGRQSPDVHGAPDCIMVPCSI